MIARIEIHRGNESPSNRKRMKHTPRGEQKKGGRPSNNKNERGWTPFPWPDTLQARALQQTGHEWWQRSARAESSSDSEGDDDMVLLRSGGIFLRGAGEKFKSFK
ncbi:hypothetical protein TNIN_202051 [Trichonephila inaurata madagascariensis]|uniref:Uncharacterized protein n=1 Tax=Trichonephila inaurata madagascariensis TaxID=2747483 RepID=A0A8X6XZ18_9ARAC|nr:hypothetical protein TNIN_202051 [Trichonephila inaurata madagascariensis]